jgi:hypothetical protein
LVKVAAVAVPSWEPAFVPQELPPPASSCTPPLAASTMRTML